MSLYLISKDAKLKASLDRQLGQGCHWICSIELLKSASSHIGHDNCPVLLIDENLSDRGHMPALELVVASKVPGARILLTGRLGYSKHDHFLFDGHVGILRKPFSVDQLIEGLVRIGKAAALEPHLNSSQRTRLEREQGDDWSSSIFIGSSESIRTIRRIIGKIGSRFSVVHINGETGTGKEVVANLLREAAGPRIPFVAINCSSIPGTLADTCLFGNAKGAYTDAKEAHAGVVKLANSGILFLDEIEDLAPEIQGNFLRLLETKQFRPIGSDKLEHSDFKLITASNVPLKRLYIQGTLRFDLYNRLNRVVINLPPLRDHMKDIPLLIEHHLSSIGEHRHPDEETLGRIMGHRWPGNVRELFKELDLLSVFAPHDAISLSYREILTETALSEHWSAGSVPLVSEEPAKLRL